MRRINYFKMFALLFLATSAQTVFAGFGTGWILDPETDSRTAPIAIEIPYQEKHHSESGDRDWFQFSVPYSMSVRIVAESRFMTDSRLRLYVRQRDGSLTELRFDDDGGKGRDAKIAIWLEAGRDYVVEVWGKRGGWHNLRIDSDDLFLKELSDSSEAFRLSDTYPPNPTWERRNHFGSIRVGSTLRREFEIISYSLERVIVDSKEIMGSDADSFSNYESLSFPDSEINGIPAMPIFFTPQVQFRNEAVVRLGYRIGSRRKYAKFVVAGNGSLARSASVYAAVTPEDTGNGWLHHAGELSLDNNVVYVRLRAPEGEPAYQLRVLGMSGDPSARVVGALVTSSPRSTIDITRELIGERLGRGFSLDESVFASDEIYLKIQLHPSIEYESGSFMIWAKFDPVEW